MLTRDSRLAFREVNKPRCQERYETRRLLIVVGIVSAYAEPLTRHS